MKLKAFILVSLFAVLGGSSFACGPFIYTAADNRIYRILPPLYKATDMAGNSFAERNLQLWSQQTGCSDTTAIRQALYSGWDNYMDWQQLLAKMHDGKKAYSEQMVMDNAFCRQLVFSANTEAVQLICWSKLYTNIRDGQRSPWYYNSNLETDEMRQLRKLYEQVGQYKPSRKYADRYAFLAIKCAWAVGDDSATLSIWQQTKRQLKGTIFYSEAEDYYARSLMRLGRTAEAETIYLRNGVLPTEASGAQRLRHILQINANASQIPQVLQEFLDEMDREQAASYNEGTVMAQTPEMLAVAREAIANPKVRNKTLWRYFAACILDFQDKPQKALAMLERARGGDAFLQGSVRVLTFYLRSKVAPIDDAFEQYAVGEIQWMDRQLVREWKHLPENNRQDISKAYSWAWMYELNNLFYYSSLRRIILEDSTGLARRLQVSGRDVRALQMANVADNRIVRLSHNEVIDSSRHCSKWEYHSWGWGKPYWNYHDYSNGLFVLADGMSAKVLEDYRQRQLHPLDATDRWFNAHSYTNGDYWQDIVATHYLRERNYAAAVAHLKFVSPLYQGRMNVRCRVDPFGLDCNALSQDHTHYKLHFAQRMDSLQQTMLHSPKADQRGLAMLEYSIGLENSFNRCWWLTSYQKGWNGADLIDIAETPYATKAKATSNQLRLKALQTLRTDEARAAYYARLGEITLVMTRYPNSSSARRFALVCDEWKNY